MQSLEVRLVSSPISSITTRASSKSLCTGDSITDTARKTLNPWVTIKYGMLLLSKENKKKMKTSQGNNMDDGKWTKKNIRWFGLGQNNVATSSSGTGLSSGHSGRYWLFNSVNEITNSYLMRLSMIAIIIKMKVCDNYQASNWGLDNYHNHANTESNNCFIMHRFLSCTCKDNSAQQNVIMYSMQSTCK